VLHERQQAAREGVALEGPIVDPALAGVRLERLEPRPALGLERRPALAQRGHVLDLVLARQRGRRLAVEAPMPDPLRAVGVDERAADPAVAALQVARERLGVEGAAASRKRWFAHSQ
jgi:hypothetical protein